MAVPLAQQHTIVEIMGSLVSQPYVAMTVAMMQAFGARIDLENPNIYSIPGKQQYHKAFYKIEPDASAASYWFAAAAIMKGRVTIPDLTEDSLQGDVRFTNILARMSCRITNHKDGAISAQGVGAHGIDVDMNAISDTVMTLAAVACFAEGPTTIRNVAHIRHKETDRLTALATELRKVGAEVEEFADGLRITPRPLHGAEIDTYNDHRMAMSMALIGLKVPGIVIKNPGCVAKTYPRFFDDLEKLRC